MQQLKYFIKKLMYNYNNLQMIEKMKKDINITYPYDKRIKVLKTNIENINILYNTIKSDDFSIQSMRNALKKVAQIYNSPLKSV